MTANDNKVTDRPTEIFFKAHWIAAPSFKFVFFFFTPLMHVLVFGDSRSENSEDESIEIFLCAKFFVPGSVGMS